MMAGWDAVTGDTGDTGEAGKSTVNELLRRLSKSESIMGYSNQKRDSHIEVGVMDENTPLA